MSTMDVASHHQLPHSFFHTKGKRSFTPGYCFQAPPAPAKRFKYEHIRPQQAEKESTTPLFPTTSWPTALETSFNSIFSHSSTSNGSSVVDNGRDFTASIKRSAGTTPPDDIPAIVTPPSSKRIKLDPDVQPRQDDETDDRLMVVSEEEETVIEEDQDQNIAKRLLFQQQMDSGDDDDILETILGFLDSISLRRYRAVSKHWKKQCEDLLVDRQLVAAAAAADSGAIIPKSNNIQWKEFPRLVFDAQFRVINNGGVQSSSNCFPRGVWDGDMNSSFNTHTHSNNYNTNNHKNNLQIEISGISWNIDGLQRSLNITNAHSNHFVNLVTSHLNCNDGLYHDLKILIERGRVFLKLDQHWLPGTIPVRELAKLLGICKWKGLMTSSSSSSMNNINVDDDEDETMAAAIVDDDNDDHPFFPPEGEIMEE